uniref:PHD finger protein 21B n=1 Tax=Nothobranchius pienaari TaxID=704102 RepID=A0A1A8QGZ9_9TELE
MELQGLQEALKVEIQCHQNQALCKGLNELQNGQLGVRNHPVGSLIKPPLSISVVPAKAPVSMVTAHMNGQKMVSSEPLQLSPINLQTGSRVAPGPGVHTFSSSRRVGDQMLGTLTAVPITVPQVGTLHRLIGPGVTVLPQIRPRTQIPNSLPHRPPQDLRPQSLHSVAAVVSPKSQGPPKPPTCKSPFSPDHQPNGQNDPCAPIGPTGGPDSSSAIQHTSPGQGVAYAIIAASPATGNRVSTVSEAVKVIIIQPQTPSCTEGSPGSELSSEDTMPTVKSPSREEDDPEKVAFMVALGLVTTEHLEELQVKRQERKRRSTANPTYSSFLEPERKRLPSHYLNSSLYLSTPDSEDLCWKEVLEHDERCFVCKEEGELQLCYNCPRAIHPSCLHPPLKSTHRSPWYCPKCQKKVLNKENLSWPQNFVQSYVTHKTVRQEEKRRLMKRNNELKKECAHLEEQDQRLNKTLKFCVDQRERLLGQQRDTQASLDRLKALITLIQVTMTTQPWIKSTSAMSATQLTQDDITN